MRQAHTRIRRGGKPARGVLLLEVLIAIVLLVGSVLLVLGVFPQAINANQQGKDLLLATNLAQKEMEAYRSMSLTELDALDPSAYSAQTFTARVRGNEHTMDFSVKRDILFVNDDLREVTITVEWDHGEIHRRTSVTTLIGAGL